ncbi:PP2C family protein-serine/threonine phosphatase [Streptomyces sp. NPDC002889]|uniref:PP2C family protein-serine/threonine phosphatase n=1 Tax=Streptomyces sp. NPDC002889 TaxID=3364669 RepID=UPI0036883BC7
MVEDAEFGSLLAALLEQTHHTDPGHLPDLVERAAREVGLRRARIFLADVQQHLLVPLASPGSEHERTGRLGSGVEGALAVDGTLAGWAYRTVSMRLSQSEKSLTLWLPLVDGIERMGVLEVVSDYLDTTLLKRCRALADLSALAVISKTEYSDIIVQTARSRPMSLAAEMVWAFLPPRTLGTNRVTSSAVLEPAYEIGGDAFDHSLRDGHLHLAVVDAMGHDLASGLSSAVAIAGCRHARRAGEGLDGIAATVDEALVRWIPDRLLTAVFADLDLDCGQLTWINCGHPPPLLIRGQHVISGALQRPSELPLGLGHQHAGIRRTVHTAQLEPGDRVLIHTDGVTEAHSPDGDYFGEQRLTDHIVRATAAGEKAPEALRRLIHTILEHQHGRLDDDATILLAEWHPRDEPAATGTTGLPADA